MIRRCWLVVLGLLLAATAQAWVPTTRAQNITFAAPTPAALRAMLRAYIDSSDTHAPQAVLDAAEGWSLLGESYRRGGVADSAAVAYAHAYAALGDRDNATALADLLIARGKADSALRVLEPLRAEAQEARVPSAQALMTRVAWATAMTGHTRDALAIAARQSDYLDAHADWAKRFATIAAEADQDTTVLRLLWPGLARSRGLDLDAMALARRAANRHLRPGELERMVGRSREAGDSLVQVALGARLGSVAASEGVSLATWTRLAKGARAPLVLILPGPGERTVTDYDSLMSQLHRAGMHVVIADARGMRNSVSATATGPEAWNEDGAQAMVERTGADIVKLVSACVAATHADPARVAVVTEGGLALPGALAVQAKGARALVLLTPAPAPVDRGWLVATLTASNASVFIQTSPEDPFGNEALDRIVTLLPPARVRAADARARGRGGALFAGDASLTPRITKWLAEVWAARSEMSRSAAPARTKHAPRRHH